ncbi:MAG: MFS transporter [Acidimicrobiales bacterium]
METVPASTTPERLVTPTFTVVTASAFAYFTALGMLLPTVPRYVEEELGGGGFAVGLAVGSFAVSAAVLRPLVGRVGDTRGRRVLVMAGTIGVGLSVLGYGLAHNLLVLVLFRLVSGACEAAVFVGAATASQDMAPPERRGEAASYFSVAIYGGFALLAILGENLRADHGFTTVWVVAAAWCVLAFVLGIGVPGGPRR